MIGKTLSHYEIKEKIGHGGMGEVYRARDTRLDRIIAVKFLPPEVANDAERIARFQREARTLASLHHPNIASIFGFEEVGGHLFLTMELVEGEDLATRLARGPVPVDLARDIAHQMTLGLEEAHSKGIVHRDLKPANVMITPDDKVKILDFGLARAYLGPSEGSGSLETSPTITAAMTAVGTILGTASYMSPEQARGKNVDARSDIWSFGCIVFELLTGARTFPGETLPESLGAIIHKDPEWNALPKGVPPAMRRLLARCLTKDITRRLQAIGEARLILEEADAVDPEAAPVATAPARTSWLLVLGVLVAGIALGALLMPAWRSAPQAIPPVKETSLPKRLTLTLPADAPLATGTFHTPFAFSPDGRTLVYVSSQDGRTRLNLRPLDSPEITLLPGTEGAEAPFYSPDGEWIGFYANNKIQKISVRGGTPRPIANLQGLRGATWLKNGSIALTISTIDSLYTVPAEGGTPQSITQVDSSRGDTSHRFPRPLPGSDAILFGILQGADYTASRIATVSSHGGEIRDLVTGSVDPRYVSTGHILFAELNSLFAVGFDPATGTLGTKVPVLHGVMSQTNTGAGYFDVSSDGTLAFVAGGATGGDFSLIWVDRDGEPTPLDTRQGTLRWPRISPRGDKYSISIYEDTEWDVWIGDIRTGLVNKATYDGDNVGAIWTPDEEHIIFSSSREGAWNLWRQRADGSGKAEHLSSSPNRQFASDVTPDGRYIIFGVKTPETGNDVLLIDTREGNTIEPFLVRPANDGGARISPDGKWAIYASDETGRWEVFITPFPKTESRWQISRDGGHEPIWSRDGKRVYYREGSRMIEATVVTTPQVAVIGTRTLFVGWYEGLLGQAEYVNFDVAPGDDRFLMLRGQGSSTREIQIITDWTGELERLVAPPSPR